MIKRPEDKHDLAALLCGQQDEIATGWAEKMHSLPGTLYNQLSFDDLKSSTSRGVAAIVNNLATGSMDAVDAYVADVSDMRLEMGFDISEVIEALLLLKEVAFSTIRQAYPAGSRQADDAVVRLDTCLRSIVGRFGHLYAEAMKRDLQAQQERTALILDAAEAANSSLRLDLVLRRIVEKSTETFGLDCALYLWDAERERLVPQIRSNRPAGEGPNSFSQIALSPATSALLLQMLACQKPVDCYELNAGPGQEMMHALGLRSALIVPIVGDERVFVVVIGSRAEECPHFTDQDIELAEGMANAVGLAIKNARLYESTRQRLTELESLQRMTKALLQKLRLEQVLEVVCQEARQLTGATGCALYSVHDEAWLQLTHSAGTLTPPASRMPLEGTLAGQAVLSGEPLLINDADGLTRTSHPIPDLESLLVVPMRLRESVVGALDVANKPNGFTQDDVQILSLFADGAAIAIESARLQQQAEQLAVIEERQRLARELHDSVTQALYSVTLYAEATRMAMSAGRQDVATENLNELHRTAREAMIDMRMLIFELRPPVLEEEGLAVALQARLAAVESRAGLQTEFLLEGEQDLRLSTQEELFWIAVEAFNNVVKHAKAQRVTVRLQLDHPIVDLWIKDDGIGFNPATAGQSGGMGLRNMAERAERIGAKLQVTSAPGSGTTISVKVEA
jgi:signal transduction histidine kinase